jgi:hypothetical protein
MHYIPMNLMYGEKPVEDEPYHEKLMMHGNGRILIIH